MHAHPSSPQFKRMISNKWFWIVLAILLAWLVWHLLHKDTEQTDAGGFGGRNGRNAASVGVATVEKADIPIILNALGTATATATVTVRPQVSGVLQQVNFHEGQMVKAGQLLATIDPRPFELALLQATGQRQRDEAQLHNAQLVLKRDLALQEQDSISQQDVEAQTALVKQLEGTVMSDKAQEGTANLNLTYTKVVAPISGRVGLRSVDIGNLVSASDTTGIAVITQITPIDVEFTVPQTQVADIQSALSELHEKNSDASKPEAAKPETLKVSVLDRSRATVLAEGDFLALDNQVDVQTGTVRAKARFDNNKQILFPNEFVNVKLMLRNIKDAIVIPISALRHNNNSDYVYVLDTETSTVSQRPVTAGQAEVDRVQIVSGLQVGEKVITEGADKLKDGGKVNLPGAPANNGNNAENKKSWNKNADRGSTMSSQVSSHTSEHHRKRQSDQSQ